MRTFLLFILLIIVFLSCSRQSRDEILLSSAEELIDERPDSALKIFDSIDDSKLSNKQKMRFYLQRNLAQNKNYIPFSSDSIMREVVSYYDKNGIKKEKQLANYLMGRVLSDMDNPIMALEYFNKALENVDTLDADCDYKTVSRIHGQMATLFHIQMLPEYELREEKLAIDYAWKGKDTLAAIQFYEHLAGTYYFLNMKDSVLSVCKNASRLYKKYGYKKKASSTWPSAICVLLERKQYAKAKRLMDDFELNSGFFDRKHETTFGHETYYGFKGWYYEGINKLDSAEFFYRKLLSFPFVRHNHEVALHGMMSVYEKKMVLDSVAKYARLCCEINDSSYRQLYSDKVCRMQSLYDYNHNKQLANQKIMETKHYKIWAYTVTLFVLVFAFIVYKVYLWLRKKRLMTLQKMNEEYSATLLEYDRTKKELIQLQCNYDEYKQTRQDEMEKFRAILSVYQSNNERSEEWDFGEMLLEEAVVKDLHRLAGKGIAVSDREWAVFVDVLGKYLPLFLQTIECGKYNLTDRELRVCMLIKLRFIPSEIRILLNLSSQQVTNARSTINKKMFGKESTKSLDNNIRML